jgi:hypothetical protein
MTSSFLQPQTTSGYHPTSGPVPSRGELASDFRARIALEQHEAIERRKRELAEQSSESNLPDARIRAWEHTHGLRLPRAAKHPVLRLIAADTQLTLDQVQQEQGRREAAPR